MLRFLVCQTSISISASEALEALESASRQVLGQIAFQEHFPIDGIAQEPSKSTKPLPRWVPPLFKAPKAVAGVRPGRMHGLYDRDHPYGVGPGWKRDVGAVSGEVVRQIAFSGVMATDECYGNIFFLLLK